MGSRNPTEMSIVQKQVSKSRAVDITRVTIVSFNIADMLEKAEPTQEDRLSGGFKYESACGQYFTDKTNRVTAGIQVFCSICSVEDTVRQKV